MALSREVYFRRKVLYGKRAERTLSNALNLSAALLELGQYAEAKALVQENIPQCRRALGKHHDLTLALRTNYAESLYRRQNASRRDHCEAMSVLDDVVKIRRRGFGLHHPYTLSSLQSLEGARMNYEDVDALPS